MEARARALRMFAVNARTAFALLLLCCCLAFGTRSGLCAEFAAAPFRLGLNADNWSGQAERSEFWKLTRDMGIEFIVWHVTPEEFSSGAIMQLIARCRAEGIAYLFNTELVNYVPDAPEFRADNGKSRRWDFSDSVLAPLRVDPLFLGVVHDESLLMQAELGATLQNKPVLPYYADTANLLPEEAYARVAEKIDALSAYYQSYGKILVLESILPDDAFAAARGGAVPAPKLLKENYNDLMLMIARGAAREYLAANIRKGRTTELWACVDLWYLDGFPAEPSRMDPKHSLGGHSPERLYDALAYAWRSGCDAVYVEHAKGLMTADWRLSAHGEKVREFDRMRRARPRPADWRTIQATITVRRFPSGNPGGRLPDFLDVRSYGSKAYRFRDCGPGKKDLSFWCTRDLQWFAAFARLSGAGGLQRDAQEGGFGDGKNTALPPKNQTKHKTPCGWGGLWNFSGLTFHSLPYGAPLLWHLRDNAYKPLAGLPEINFVDQLSPPLGEDDSHLDFYGTGP